MKNFLIMLIVVFGSAYYFIPYDTKVVLLEKAGIDSSIISSKVLDSRPVGEVVDLKFNEIDREKYSGDISVGLKIDDLSWGSLPYVKCFDSGLVSKFSGNTVHHRILLGKRKNISVKLTQDNPEDKLSIYVYKTDALSKVYPPEKEYTFDCKSNTSGDSEINIDMGGNTITSDIVIGITGAEGVIKGSYSLELIQK